MLLITICTPLVAILIIRFLFPARLDEFSVNQFNHVIQNSFLPMGILLTLLHIKMKKVSSSSVVILQNCITSFVEFKFDAICDWNSIHVLYFQKSFFLNYSSNVFKQFVTKALSEPNLKLPEIDTVCLWLQRQDAFRFNNFCREVARLLNIPCLKNCSRIISKKLNLKWYPKTPTARNLNEEYHYLKEFTILNRKTAKTYLNADLKIVLPTSKITRNALVLVIQKTHAHSKVAYVFKNRGKLIYPSENVNFNDWTNVSLVALEHHYDMHEILKGLDNVYKEVFKHHPKALREFLKTIEKPHDGILYKLKCITCFTVEKKQTFLPDVILNSEEDVAVINEYIKNINFTDSLEDFKRELKAKMSLIESIFNVPTFLSGCKKDFLTKDDADCDWNSEIKISLGIERKEEIVQGIHNFKTKSQKNTSFNLFSH